jgi:hypothetical protein
MLGEKTPLNSRFAFLALPQHFVQSPLDWPGMIKLCPKLLSFFFPAILFCYLLHPFVSSRVNSRVTSTVNRFCEEGSSFGLVHVPDAILYFYCDAFLLIL